MSEVEGDGGDGGEGGEGPSGWAAVSCSFAVLLAVALSYKRLDANGGKNWKIHAAFGVATLLAVGVVPESLSSYVFTQLTVTLVGAVYPIYR